MRDENNYYKPEKPFQVKVDPPENKKLASAVLNCFVQPPPIGNNEYERPMYDFDDYRVEFNKTYVKVSRMYELLPMNFRIMKALGDLFKTEELNVNSSSMPGCETCDYGSKYEHTIWIPEEKLTQTIKEYTT